MNPVVTRVLPRAQSDSRLVELARAGDQQAFEAIVERYRGRLYSYCRRLLSDTAADDAVQQALLSAWSALQNGTEVRELRPWLYRIAHNAMLKIVTRNGEAEAELPEELGGHESPATQVERKLELRTTLMTLAGLPAHQRDALVGTAVHGRSREEMASRLGLSVGAVRQLVHRARTTLRGAASAVVPFPLLVRLSNLRDHAAQGTSNVGDVAAAAGSAAAGAALKWGVVLSVTGAMVATPLATGVDPGTAADRPPQGAAAAPPVFSPSDPFEADVFLPRVETRPNRVSQELVAATDSPADPAEPVGAGDGSRPGGSGPVAPRDMNDATAGGPAPVGEEPGTELRTAPSSDPGTGKEPIPGDTYTEPAPPDNGRLPSDQEPTATDPAPREPEPTAPVDKSNLDNAGAPVNP